MIKVDVVICCYVDICLRYGVSILQWNDKCSQCISVFTTKFIFYRMSV